MLKSDVSTVTEYFNSAKSISLSPLVSAEWNYNNIYQPYATYSGDGLNKANNMMLPQLWTIDSKYTTVLQSSNSYVTSVFSSPRKCLQIVKEKNASYDTYSDNVALNLEKVNWHSKITAKNIPVDSGNNCYKIIFYAKSVENNLINISATASHPDFTANISYSVSDQIDDTEWKKIEILFGVRPADYSGKVKDPSYSTINLSIDLTNTTYKQANWNVLIDRFEIYQITYFDFLYGSLWDTNAVFNPNRPGESYVTTGNSNFVLPTNFRKVITGAINYDSTGGSINWLDNPTGNAWNAQMPCSPATYSPNVLFGFHSNPLFKNGMVSPFSKYKYFVSEKQNASIGATYEEKMKVNKIVLKFNLSQSKPSGLVLNLYNTSGATNLIVDTIHIDSTDIDSSGTCVLYYHPHNQKLPVSRQWTTERWNSSQLPVIDNINFDNFIFNNDKHSITNIVGNGSIVTVWTPDLPLIGSKVKIIGATTAGYNGEFVVQSTITEGGNRFTITSSVTGASSSANYCYPAYQEINKMVLTQVSSTLANPDYDVLKEDVKNELHKLQVIEISPRLELDMSEYVINFDIAKELDNKSNLVPISAISSNNANISFTNIPWQQVGAPHQPLALFSTNSSISPFKSMLVKNVKFYINYFIRDAFESAQNRTIPGGVFYADTWDTRDIETTSVSCFDITKYLQLLAVNDYATAGGQTLLKIITNVLDFSGFTDYDYDQLANICNDNNQKLTLNYFFADSKNKTVFDILRELFTAYQIGAYVDEYGVLKFLNLNNLNRNNATTFTLTDSNIATKGYDETVKTKIGKINLRYKTPQITRTISMDSSVESNGTTTTPQPDMVWKQDNTDVVTFNYLQDSILSTSQHFFDLSVADFETIFHGISLDSDGYCVIEGEIMSMKGKQIRFTTNNGSSQDMVVTSSNELQSALAEYAYNYGFANVTHSPTGRIANVERGLFRSAIKPHIVMKTSTDVDNKFECIRTNRVVSDGVVESLTPTSTYVPSPTLYNLISIEQPKNTRTYMVARNTQDKYLTYSTKFKFDRRSTANQNAGLFMFLQRNSDKTAITGSTYFVEIEQGITMVSAGGTKTHADSYEDIKVPKTNYTLKVYALNNIGILGPTLGKIEIYTKDITREINNIYANQPRDDYSFNKDFINLRCVINNDQTLSIFLNKTQIVSKKDGVSVPATASGEFGFFTNGGDKGSTSVELFEIYACEKQIDNPYIYYHFQDTQYLNSLIVGNNTAIRYYMTQSKPEVIGLNFYDVQLTPAPVLGADILKVSYSFLIDQTVNGSPSTFFSVQEDALSYSDVLNSGFRAKFAAINTYPYAIWTKKESDPISSTTVDFAVNTQYLLSLGMEKNIEKIIDEKNNELLEIQTDWIQSSESARSIVNTIALAVDNFSKDTTITLFGNPLIQIGDVASVQYNLLNIGYDASLGNQPLKYFVQSVKQSYNQGLTTTLTMNKITYTGDPAEKSVNYVPPKTVKSLTSTPLTAFSPTSTVTPAQVDSNSITASSNISLSWDSVKDATSYNINFQKVNRTLEATLTHGIATVDLTSGTTNKMIVGQTLVKTSGAGAFGVSAKVLSIQSATSFTASVNHATSGAISFNDPCVTIDTSKDFTVLNHPRGTVGTKTTYVGNTTFSVPTGKSPYSGFDYDPYKDGDRIKISISSFNSSSNIIGSASTYYYYTVQPGIVSTAALTPICSNLPRTATNDISANEGAVTLSVGTWSNVDSQTIYTYQWQFNDGSGWQNFTTDSTSYQYYYTGIADRTEIRCQVTASNGEGTLTPSSTTVNSTVVVILPIDPTAILEVVKLPQAYVRYDGKVVVSWTDAPYPAAFFKVEVFGKEGESWERVIESTVASGVQNAIIDVSSFSSARFVNITTLDENKNLTNQVTCKQFTITPMENSIHGFDYISHSGNMDITWARLDAADYYIVSTTTYNVSANAREDRVSLSPTTKTVKVPQSEFGSISTTLTGYSASPSITVSITPVFPNNIMGTVKTFDVTVTSSASLSPASVATGRRVGIDE